MPARRPPAVMVPWLTAQSINVSRHVGALRPFEGDEFGSDAAAPSAGHIQAVNSLINTLRSELVRHTKEVTQNVQAATLEPTPENLGAVVRHKEHAHNWVQAIERIWDFYFELFGQRQSRAGRWLLSCDRIAVDCYQRVFTHLGTVRSIPAPPPFCYMRTGFSPATFRRGIPLRRLGQQINPFPLIQLPYHRLVNPWTLGAILHEVSHNFQNELGLQRSVPRKVARELLRAGFPPFVAAVWTRWNRESFADLAGLLLGGPAVVASLMDVVGRSRSTVLHYTPRAPHPTMYLRVFLSCELLRRMGFPDEAQQYWRSWSRLYPNPRAGNIPPLLLDTFPDAIKVVVDAMCYQPYGELGSRTLAQVMQFDQRYQQMVEEAARRLASGTDPGIIPERLLIGASRFALDNRLARPGVIAENFYTELARR